MRSTFLILCTFSFIINCSSYDVLRGILQNHRRPVRDRDVYTSNPDSLGGRINNHREYNEEALVSTLFSKTRRARPRIRPTTHRSLRVDEIELTTRKPARLPLLHIYDNAPDTTFGESKHQVNFTVAAVPRVKNDKVGEASSGTYEVYEVIVGDTKPPPVPKITLNHTTRKPTPPVKSDENNLEDLSLYSSEEDEEAFGKKIKSRKSVTNS